MPGLADCYVLVNSRSKELVEEFLAHFMPQHRALADEYEVPQYSEKPIQVFQTAGDALAYFEKHHDETHALYWENQACGEARFGMVFPTFDGQMIFGLSCRSEDEGIADILLDTMKHFLNSDIGCIAFEKPPPATAQEFVEVVRSLRTE